MHSLVNQMILSLVVEDDMNLLRPRPANVRSKHDKIRSIPMHVSRLEVAVEQLDVPSATVNVLLMLHAELEHKCLLLVCELWECG